MKKVNKTLLLASTLFVSQVFSLTNNAYADEAKHEGDDPGKLANYDNDNSTEINEISEPIKLSNPKTVSLPEESESSQLPQDITTEEIPQENTTDQATSDNKDEEIVKYDDRNLDEDLVIYDDRNLDEVLNLLDDEDDQPSSQVETTIKNEDQVAPKNEENIANKSENQKEIGQEKEETKEATEEKSESEVTKTELTKTDYYAPKGTGVIVTEGKSQKYYEDDKLVTNAKVILNDKFYDIDSKGNATSPKSSWNSIGNKVYYVNETGSILKGINQVKEKKYYFNNLGELQRNKRLVTAESYYEVSAKGEMITPTNTWVELNKNIYYNDANGKLAKGVVNIKGNPHYFDDKGILTRNKKILTDSKYYIVDDKGMVTNPKDTWFNMGGNVYKTDSNGNLLTGLQKIGEETRLFSSEGKMFRDTKVISAGKFYEVDAKGNVNNPKNSWVEKDGQKYHTNEAGFVKEGVWKIDNEYYYFTANGLTPNQVVTQKGVVYTVDENGIATKQDNNIPGEKSIDKVMEWMFNARAAGMTYNMGAGRNSATQADCSSAVYRALIYGGFLDKGTWVGNTETLFKMGAKGSIMYEIKESEIQHGDIFVAGTPGGSMGAAGHTGFILNPIEDTIIHMTYSKNGVAVTNRKGHMGDGRGLPVRYYRLVGANSTNIYENNK